MIDMSTGLRHMAWANAALYAHLATLPAEAFGASVTPESWSVGRLTVHIAGGAEWYRYCLNGTPWTDLDRDWTAADVVALAPYQAELDATLLAEAEAPDAHMTFEDEDGPRSVSRSILLTQATHHATEHRAEIAAALAVHGHPRFDLDAIDLWAFAAHERA